MTEPGATAGARLLWVGIRLIAWLGLYIAFELVGAALLADVPLSGKRQLLFTGVTLTAAVLAGVLLLRWLDHRPARDLGFALNKAAPVHFAIGLAIGVGALLLVAGLMMLAGWLSFVPDDGTTGAWGVTLLSDLGLMGVAAAAEEAMFRGYPFQVLARAAGAPLAVIVSSAAFAWAHNSNPNVDVIGLLNILLAGVLLAVAYLLTRSLWFATAIHLGWNWSMASLVDLPVSGLELFDTPLYEPVLRGPAWATGGAFGPEGGLTGTIAFGAAIAAVWWYARKRRVMETA
jgi:membrane protease YdiL (CAAX protease family)